MLELRRDDNRIAAVVLRSTLASRRGYALARAAVSQSSSLFALVVGLSSRCRGLDGLCVLMGERSGRLQPFWAATNGWHHHSTCASRGFASECRLERWDPCSLGDIAG